MSNKIAIGSTNKIDIENDYFFGCFKECLLVYNRK